MSTVDFYVSPDRAEFREEIQQAFRELNLGGVEETDPTERDALLGVRFPDGLSDAEIEDSAETLRTALAGLLTGGPIVSFKRPS